MFWLKLKNEDEQIKKLIKNQADFVFAKNEVKLKLLASLPIHERPQEQVKWLGLPRYAFAAVCVILAIGLTSTMAYADTAKPGDRLFALDLLQEAAILKLTPSSHAKARLQAKFVAERARELQQLTQIANHQEQKIKAVDQSVKNLNQAIESVSKARNRMKTEGNDQTAARLDIVLTNLQDLAETHEQKTNEIRMRIDDEQLKNRLDEDLDEIKKAKLRVRLELNQNDNNLLP
ncbi:MAG: hypothetical protein HY545_02370 [Candidatus Doudnabacteria bacterium]|nr:hypothetical protein [Candidatus Doudnabacteria bacterium]